MLMRHDTNGSERTTVLMARIATGTPLAFQWLRTFGVKIDRVRTESFRGEWQIPRHCGARDHPLLPRRRATSPARPPATGR